MNTCLLEYQGLYLKVSADPETLSWLKDFMACGFQTDVEGSYQRAVSLHIDPTRHRKLLALRPESTDAKLVSLANDTHDCLVEECHLVGLFFDAENQVFFQVQEDSLEIEIIAAELNRLVRLVLMKVVRELVQEHLYKNSVAIFHSAAVMAPEGVILLCGPRQSGKTTTLLSLLDTCGLPYVSNDRTAVWLEGPKAFCRGVPTLVSIRPGTLDLRPELRSRLQTVTSHPLSANGNQYLNPPELINLVGCSTSVGGPLAALVCLEFDPQQEGFQISPWQNDEALQACRRGVFRASRIRALGQIFQTGANFTDSTWTVVRPIAQKLIDSGKVYHCRTGQGTAFSQAQCQRFLEQIAKLSSSSNRTD